MDEPSDVIAKDTGSILGLAHTTCRTFCTSRDANYLLLRDASNERTNAFMFVNQHSDRHAPGITKSAICVQRFDDSLNSAIHITYRSLLRSSSMHEPRDPPLKVVRF